MTKEIVIDGRTVVFRATAAVPRLYRIKFRRDIMQDMKSAENGDGNIPMRLLEVFENVAFIMAKHGNPEMKESSPEEWLDTFDTFSIYSIFPELMDLWRANNESLADIKKKLDQQSGS